MSDVEDRVRHLLERHAAEAPAGAALLTAVRVESRRRTRRTRVVVASVLAVLTAAGITVPLRLAAVPVTVAAPSALAPPSGPATVTFPLSPPLPSDVPDLRLTAGLPVLSHPLPETDVIVTLTVSPTRPPGTATDDEPVMVRGVHGYTVETPDTGISLVWQEAPGQWFELQAFPVVPVDRLAGFAKSLQSRPVSVPAPFTFALVPVGYAIDNISPAAVTFCPPDVTADGSFVGKITVMLGVTGEQSAGRPVDVAGRPGILTDPGDGFSSLQVDLGDGRLLVIQSAVPASLPEADLLRFAAGITVNPNATLGQG